MTKQKQVYDYYQLYKSWAETARYFDMTICQVKRAVQRENRRVVLGIGSYGFRKGKKPSEKSMAIHSEVFSRSRKNVGKGFLTGEELK